MPAPIFLQQWQKCVIRRPKTSAQPSTTNVWLSQLRVPKPWRPQWTFALRLLGVTFVAGGFVGGLMGGSLILWANSPQGVAILAGTPTPTQAPTPTPMPVATATPILIPTPGSNALHRRCHRPDYSLGGNSD